MTILQQTAETALIRFETRQALTDALDFIRTESERLGRPQWHKNVQTVAVQDYFLIRIDKTTIQKH